MSKEKKAGLIVLFNSPQNSKDPDLTGTDLLTNHIFRNVVVRFDRALGVEPNQSLAEANQFACVVMSVAAHSAFAYGLKERLQPGQIYPSESIFRLSFVGHSVGEMASLIEAGITDIDKMAWILKERQEITERPFAEGVARFMLAVVGVDIRKFEKAFKKPIKKEFGKGTRVTLANRNTPSQGVVSVETSEGDPRSVARRLTDLFREFQYSESEKPPRFLHLQNIRNSFHSIILSKEEKMLQRFIAQRLKKEDFSVLKPERVYSPMLGRWIKSDKDAWEVVNRQLTLEVKYSEAIQRLSHEPDLVAFVSADVKEDITPKMLRDNIGDKVPQINIKDMKSLNDAIEQTSELLLAA